MLEGYLPNIGSYTSERGVRCQGLRRKEAKIFLTFLTSLRDVKGLFFFASKGAEQQKENGCKGGRRFVPGYVKKGKICFLFTSFCNTFIKVSIMQ